MKRLALVIVLFLAACATTGDFTTNATKATMLVDQVTNAADSAVKAGLLKGQDAQTTLAAIKAARDGINSAKAMSVASPSQADGALGIATATLVATQTYLATLGSKK